MPMLHIETEVVRKIIDFLNYTAVSLQTTSQTLTNTVYALSNAWQGHSRDQFLGEFQPLNQRLAQLADEGLILSQRLQREVEEWEQVASQFGGGAVASWQSPLPVSAGGGQNPWLPSILSDFSIDLPSLSIISLLGGWSAQWPDWLKERLSPFLPFLQPPPPPVATPTPSGPTRLGELLDDPPPPEPKAEPISPPTAVSPPAQPVPPIPPTNGYSVPIKSQGTLGGSAACAPTSVSMILDYYHNLDPQNKTAAPAELLAMLDKGDFTHGKGMSLNQITDELQDLGYHDVTAQVDAGLSDLQNHLQQGPVITTVRLDMKSGQLAATGSVVHAVVVKGLSADGQTVFINDPWTGSEVRLPVADFAATWQGGKNGLYVIRP